MVSSIRLAVSAKGSSSKPARRRSGPPQGWTSRAARSQSAKQLACVCRLSPAPAAKKTAARASGSDVLVTPKGMVRIQFVLRTGQRHIQQPQLLTAHLLGVALGQCRVGGGLVGALALGRPQTKPSPAGAVQQDRLANIHCIEAAAGLRQDHHRELKPLGTVDGHNADAAGMRPGGNGVLPCRASQRRRIHRPHQSRDSACAGAGAERRKPVGIFPAAGAVFHCSQRRQIACGGKDLLHQPVGGQTAGQAAQFIQPGTKLPQFLVEGGLGIAVRCSDQQRRTDCPAAARLAAAPDHPR